MGELPSEFSSSNSHLINPSRTFTILVREALSVTFAGSRSSCAAYNGLPIGAGVGVMRRSSIPSLEAA